MWCVVSCSSCSSWRVHRNELTVTSSKVLKNKELYWLHFDDDLEWKEQLQNTQNDCDHLDYEEFSLHHQDLWVFQWFPHLKQLLNRLQSRGQIFLLSVEGRENETKKKDNRFLRFSFDHTAVKEWYTSNTLCRAVSRT
jgi:hypothetical protein